MGQRRGVVWFRRIGAVVLGLLLLGGAYYGYWAVFDYRWTTVVEGRLYQSMAMPPAVLARVAVDQGLHAVIDLREDAAAATAERAALAGVGVRYYHLPSRQIPRPETVKRFREIIDECGELPVLIHCKHGEGRSVLFAAMWQMEKNGACCDQAWADTVRMPPLMRGIDLECLRPNAEKHAFLMAYRPRPDAATGATRAH